MLPKEKRGEVDARLIMMERFARASQTMEANTENIILAACGYDVRA